MFKANFESFRRNSRIAGVLFFCRSEAEKIHCSVFSVPWNLDRLPENEVGEEIHENYKTYWNEVEQNINGSLSLMNRHFMDFENNNIYSHLLIAVLDVFMKWLLLAFRSSMECILVCRRWWRERHKSFWVFYSNYSLSMIITPYTPDSRHFMDLDVFIDDMDVTSGVCHNDTYAQAALGVLAPSPDVTKTVLTENLKITKL